MTSTDISNLLSEPGILLFVSSYLQRMRPIVFLRLPLKSKNGGTPTTNS